MLSKGSVNGLEAEGLEGKGLEWAGWALGVGGGDSGQATLLCAPGKGWSGAVMPFPLFAFPT